MSARDEHGQESSEVATVQVAAGGVDQQRVDRDAPCAVVLTAETMGERGGGRISPYITHVIRRFGNWILNLTPPAANPTTRLDVESQVLFAP